MNQFNDLHHCYYPMCKNKMKLSIITIIIIIIITVKTIKNNYNGYASLILLLLLVAIIRVTEYHPLKATGSPQTSIITPQSDR